MGQFLRRPSSSARAFAAAASSTLAAVGGATILVSSFGPQRQDCSSDQGCACYCEQKSQTDVSTEQQQQLLSLSPASSSSSSNYKKNSTRRPRLVFLGTGSSTGCPRPLCPMVFGVQPECKEEGHDEDSSDEQDPNESNIKNSKTKCNKSFKEFLAQHCQVSNLAMQGGDPRQNRNYRNNPSLLISHIVDEDDDQSGQVKNIVIDVGKTFRETALRWFPVRGISSLDAIILTHEHADAVFGLDDVRGFQTWQLVPTTDNDNEDGGGVRPEAIPMEIHLSQHCLEDMRVRFPWLFPLPKTSDSPSAPPALARNGKPVIQRHVASFDVRVFQPLQPFEVQGLSIVPLPVMHGEDLVSMGFAFTLGRHDAEKTAAGHRRRPTNVVYLSDISRMQPETMDYIQNKLPQPTDILILDALHPVQTNPTHFNLVEAVELVRQIQPKQVYLVGMSCDSFLPHDEMNAKLLRDYGNIQLAHDGLEIEC
jgi:phosphoribosyl 1,2-cyclic phosphodiesterase